MKHKNFACFILTHNRPKQQHTLRILRNYGYTGKIYLIVDNEDPSREEYKRSYENVIIFDKKESARETDRCDCIEKRNTVIFARNSCHKIARELGLDYFLELDDDYYMFHIRFYKGVQL